MKLSQLSSDIPKWQEKVFSKINKEYSQLINQTDWRPYVKINTKKKKRLFRNRILINSVLLEISELKTSTFPKLIMTFYRPIKLKNLSSQIRA